MAQSNNESNERVIPPFLQNHMGRLEQSLSFSNHRKKNVEIKNLLNPSERHRPQPPTLENPTDESQSQRKTRIERNIQEQ